jgi:KDO2-lipid IV(A) lauroyltransferase
MSDEGGGGRFAHDGLFWRRLATLGARNLPTWWIRYSPPFFGLAAAVAVPKARHAVRRNLRRIRGEKPLYRDVIDTSRTFMAYAGSLAEILAYGSKNEGLADAEIVGTERMHEAVALGKGVLLLTLHTGGWEVAGPMFLGHIKLDVMLVMAAERNADARGLQDRAREAGGMKVAHVGEDPLASLPLLRHLREKGAVAMQIDRPPPNGRVVPVTLLGQEDALPEGPFMLAQLSGAPMVAVFSMRRGFRDYYMEVSVPRTLPRRATPEQVRAVAQGVADDMTAFLRAHPTQWFHW